MTTTYADTSRETTTFAVAGPDAGLQIATTDRNNVQTIHAFDASGRRIGTTVAAGTPVAVTTTAAYVPGNKHLPTVVVSAGERTETVYDDRLRVAEVRRTLPGGLILSESRSYDQDDHLAVSTDAYGRRTLLVRDVNERVIRTIRELIPSGVPAGADPATLTRVGGANPPFIVEDTQFDAEGQVLARIDGDGSRTAFAYDSQGRLVASTEAAGSAPATTSFAYDLAGNLITVTSPRGVRTAMTYTGRNLLAAVTEAVGSSEQAVVRKLTYTPTKKPATEADALDRITNFAYGTCCDRLKKVTDPAGFQTAFLYDFVGNRTVGTDANGLTTTTVYDARNRPVTVTNAAGEISRMVYDDSLTDGGGLDAIPVVQTALTGIGFGVGADGSAVAVVNPNGETAYEIRDGLGRPVVRIDPLGHLTRLAYDTIISGLVETAQTDALGHVTKVRTDGAGHARIQIDALGNQSNAGFNADGDQVSQVDAGNIGWTAAFDDRHRLLARTSTRTDATEQTQWSYDLDGNRLTETDALGKTETSQFDLRNRRTVLIDRLNGKTRFGYDAVGNLLAISDAENEARGGLSNVAGTTQYAYESRNLLTAEAFPNGQRGRMLRAYLYDGGRRLTARRVGILTGAFNAAASFTGAPEATSYQYDMANRLTVRGYMDARNDRFGYDPAGRLVLARSDRYGNSVNRSYDADGRLVTEQLALDAGVGLLGQYLVPAIYPVRYAYDSANRTVAITYPDGSVSGRGYSDRNELAGVTYQGLPVVMRSYDVSGRLVATAFGNGQIESRNYQPGSMLPTHLRTAAVIGPVVATDFVYRFDAAGRKLAEDDLATPSASQAFVYDVAGRLIDWKRGTTAAPTAKQSWSLSLVGDWNSTTRDGVLEPRQNTWVHEAVRVGTDTLVYDPKGNMTRDEDGQVYAWDPENRLALAMNLPASASAWGIASYAYDALGRRVSKLVDGRRIDFASAGAQVVQTTDIRAPAASVLEVASDGSVIAPYQTPRGGGIFPSSPGHPIVRVNFQPATEQIPEGYLADKGRTLAWRTNGRRYGWSADTASSARVRGMVTDAAWDTNMEVGIQTWKMALPNGNYPVAIVAGDAAFTDSANHILVNGQLLTDLDPGTSQPGYTKGDFDAWLVQVLVTDGFLTIKAGAGAVKPKLCLIEVGDRGGSIAVATRTRLATQVQSMTDQTAGTGIPPQQGVKKTYVYQSYVDDVAAYLVTQGTVTQRYFVHSNHLYSPAALTDGTGRVVERVKYSAYGRATITAPGGVVLAKSVIGFDRGFTGYVADNETGLLHARARQYSPTLGRFVSRDPNALEPFSAYVENAAIGVEQGVDTSRVAAAIALMRGRALLPDVVRGVMRQLGIHEVNDGKTAFKPNSRDGYHDGMCLYASAFVPNRLDPTGEIPIPFDQFMGFMSVPYACWVPPFAICNGTCTCSFNQQGTIMTYILMQSAAQTCCQVSCTCGVLGADQPGAMSRCMKRVMQALSCVCS